MSNICWNLLTVYGPAAIVTAFVNVAHGTAHCFKPEEHDLRWEQERRKRCERDGTPFVSDAERAAEPQALSFHRLVPLPAEVLARGYNEIVDGKARLMRHVPAQPEGNALAEYMFDTPWSPPLRWLRAVSWDDRWYKLGFALSWGEEDCNRGRYMIEQRMTRLSLEEYPTKRERDYVACAQTYRRRYITTHPDWLVELGWEPKD